MYLRMKFLYTSKKGKHMLMQLFSSSLILKHCSWQPDSKFPYSQVRLPPKPDNKVEFAENQEVEVYSRANSQEANGWWKVRIKVS